MAALYLIEAVDPKCEHFVYEALLARATREALATDLCQGQYDVGPIARVIEVDLSKGYSRDVSDSIASDVAFYSRQNEQELHGPVKSFVEIHGFEGHVAGYAGPRLWRTRIEAAPVPSGPRAPGSERAISRKGRWKPRDMYSPNR